LVHADCPATVPCCSKGPTFCPAEDKSGQARCDPTAAKAQGFGTDGCACPWKSTYDATAKKCSATPAQAFFCNHATTKNACGACKTDKDCGGTKNGCWASKDTQCPKDVVV
jgi:hypothetical protein